MLCVILHPYKICKNSKVPLTLQQNNIYGTPHEGNNRLRININR
jgi:hypothetical protein